MGRSNKVSKFSDIQPQSKKKRGVSRCGGGGHLEKEQGGRKSSNFRGPVKTMGGPWSVAEVGRQQGRKVKKPTLSQICPSGSCVTNWTME